MSALEWPETGKYYNSETGKHAKQDHWERKYTYPTPHGTCSVKMDIMWHKCKIQAIFVALLAWGGAVH